MTGVGGTEFSEASASYWNASNGPTFAPALSYIPETSWNDSGRIPAGFASSGGGASKFFLKPFWQSGPGVPADSLRDVPDVSLTASGAHDPYLVVMGGNFNLSGGTSAAAPAFAGMLVLLNQYAVAAGVQLRPGLGNIGPNLYWLAQNTTGVFHDVTLGSNIVSCQIGSADCYTGVLGYMAGPGYDQVTGLGSIDATNFVLTWADAFAPGRFLPTALTPTR